MTDRAALLMDLADRVEKAQGADRELDAEIALAVGIVRERDGDCFYGHKNFSVLVLERDYYAHDGNAPELAHLTAYLDAALSLVPEGWRWSLDHTQNPPYRDCGRATLYAPGDGWTPADVSEIYGATPALALCAAALRALASGAPR